tara:strand:+ start:172348 stop:173421 length:1074 start_codon:yes stop_codon:yes gene_type:complete
MNEIGSWWPFLASPENRGWAISCAVAIVVPLLVYLFRLLWPKVDKVWIVGIGENPPLDGADSNPQRSWWSELTYGALRMPFMLAALRQWSIRFVGKLQHVCLTVKLCVFYRVPWIDYIPPDSPMLKSNSVFNQMDNSSSFYWGRFLEAFPSLREPRVFTEASVIDYRLSKLLKYPLSASSDDGTSWHRPIWWTEGHSNMYLSRWYRLKPSIFLLGNMELKIKKIVSIPGAVYWQNFVYVECSPMEPTGLYTYKSGDADNSFYRPNSEEYAVYRNKKFTRAEYDDGGYEKNGRVFKFKSEPQLRERIIVPFNFMLVAADSPVLSLDVDDQLETYLAGCLDGIVSHIQLANWLLGLRRR